MEFPNVIMFLLSFFSTEIPLYSRCRNINYYTSIFCFGPTNRQTILHYYYNEDVCELCYNILFFFGEQGVTSVHKFDALSLGK